MRVEEVVDRVVARFIGTKHERDIKRLAPTIVAMNALAPDYDVGFPSFRLSEVSILVPL